MSSSHRHPAIDRREFLRRGTALGLGVGLAPLSAQAAEPASPGVRRKVTLGRTGLEISDIGFGSSRLSGDQAVVRHALERGINYFDTAEGYTGGDSETTLGQALSGRRDEVILASKVKCETGDRQDALMKALEGSLRRLQTDRVEIYFNHAVNDPDRMKNDEWFEFATKAKAQGKIRFTGMSGHGGRLVECLDLAVDEDLVDAVLVGFNFGQDPAFYQRFTSRFDFVAVQPDLPRVLAKARKKKIGVIAMKTLRGGRLNDMRPYEGGAATFAQAALRWALSSSAIDSLIVTMKSPEMVDEYLVASGWQGEHRQDAALLSRYARRTHTSQCRYGCSDCAGACPHGVPVPEVLRTRMYALDYEDPGLARADYARLGAGAEPCLGCDGSPCAGACPHGIEFSGLLPDTHRQLV